MPHLLQAEGKKGAGVGGEEAFDTATKLVR
jgi:hypothetical protein